MDLRIRLFLDTIIADVNAFDDIPLEARRLVLESAMHLVEKASDKAIAEQTKQEAQNAESIFENQLGELSERRDSDQ
jgi:hypothetical protein